MNKEQLEGRLDQVTGKIKEEVGDAFDDSRTEAEGNTEKNLGKVKAGYGDLKEDVKDVFRKDR